MKAETTAVVGVRGNSGGGGSLSSALVPSRLPGAWSDPGSTMFKTSSVPIGACLACSASVPLCSGSLPYLVLHSVFVFDITTCLCISWSPPSGRHKNNKPPFPFWGFHSVLSRQAGHTGDLWAIEVLPYLALECTIYYIPHAKTLFLAPTCSFQILWDRGGKG